MNELKTLIKHSKYNALQLSKILGYSPSVVYGWYYGIREPCARDMLRLSELLNVSVERIVRIFGE
jgi:transcriptional regulator with XRE-family HTH domain